MADIEFQDVMNIVADNRLELLGALSSDLASAVRVSIQGLNYRSVDWFPDADPTGVTDSSAALTAAIADLPASGGVVRVGEGTYLAEDIDIPDNVRFVGAGIGATTIKILNGLATTKHLFRRHSTELIGYGGIEHMTLDGQGTQHSNSGYNGIHLRDSPGFKNDTGTPDVGPSGNNGRWKVANCEVTGFYIGLHGTEDDRHLQIENNYFRDSWVGFFTTHHSEFVGQNDFRNLTYGVGHGSIVSGGTTGLFDQVMGGLKISADYCIWPITVDDSNIVQTTHYIAGEELQPLRACDLTNSMFSGAVCAIAVGTFTTVRGCQFIFGSNVRTKAAVVVGSPDDAQGYKQVQIQGNVFRSAQAQAMVPDLTQDLNMFLQPVSTTGKAITAVALPSAGLVEITVASLHGLITGDQVKMKTIGGITGLDDQVFTINVTSTSVYTLNGTDGDNYSGTYTSGGDVIRGRRSDCAAVVVDSAQGAPSAVSLFGNQFNFDTITNGQSICILATNSQHGLASTPTGVHGLDISHNSWRDKPSVSQDSQFLYVDDRKQKLTGSRIAFNNITIDTAGGSLPIIHVPKSDARISNDYIGNRIRTGAGRYGISADIEDGTVSQNFVLEGLGYNFTGIDPESNITGNPVLDTRDGADNIWRS